MSNCAGCGEPIGHASEIVVTYKEDAVEEDAPSWTDEVIKSFGQRECREIFEEYHDITEEDIVRED